MLKLVVLTLLCHCTLAVVPADKIDSLPGINYHINFDQYSGYLNPDNQSNIHYWFLESQNEPTTDPLVLWLNGGPGCSSLFGLLDENGPFLITNVDNTVAENVYGWNKFANMLYLESPAGVGYSYSYDPTLTFDDNKTAILNYNSLVDFFNKYPEYSNRDFYISGESYGGVYLPMLADQIIADPQMVKRFKGVVIGNGYLSDPAQMNSVVPFMYMHMLVGEEIWAALSAQCCNDNAINCDYYTISEGKKWDNCYNWTMLIANMPTAAGLDPYNLYDTCYVDTSVQNRIQAVEYQTYLRKLGITLDNIQTIARANGIESSVSDASSNYPDCYYSGYALYLNRPEVRTALHIPDGLPEWQDCNMTMNMHLYKSLYPNEASHLSTIFNANIPVLCYNGDVDTVCNALGDQRFIASLKRKQLKHTVPWNYTHDTYQVAGWQTRYEGIDFLTVRGSGHYVPHDKPRESMQMMYNFIKGHDYSNPTGIDVTPQPLNAASNVRFGQMFKIFVTLVTIVLTFSNVQ